MFLTNEVLFPNMGIIETHESASLNMTTNSDSAGQPDNIYFSEKSCMCCVGFVDIVDSTRITAGLTTHQMSKYYSLFINWVSVIISGYSDRVKKKTGAGLFFFFVFLGSPPIKPVKNSFAPTITL